MRHNVLRYLLPPNQDIQMTDRLRSTKTYTTVYEKTSH